jgi:hypothetical protein
MHSTFDEYKNNDNISYQQKNNLQQFEDNLKSSQK